MPALKLNNILEDDFYFQEIVNLHLQIFKTLSHSKLICRKTFEREKERGREGRGGRRTQVLEDFESTILVILWAHCSPKRPKPIFITLFTQKELILFISFFMPSTMILLTVYWRDLLSMSDSSISTVALRGSIDNVLRSIVLLVVRVIETWDVLLFRYLILSDSLLLAIIDIM